MKKRITENSFNNIIANSIKNNKAIIIDSPAYRKFICNNKTYFYNKPKEHNKFKKSNNEVFRKFAKTFFAQIKRSYDNYIIKNDFQIPKVEKKYKLISGFNKSKWKDIPINDYFVIIDIEHCYWQILFNNKIITKKFYEEHLHPDFKLLRNLTIGYMAQPKKIKITNLENKKNITFDNNLEEFMTGSNIINCDISLYKQIFENVRNTSANVMGFIANEILDGNFIKYVTDGITFYSKDPNVRRKINDWITENKLTSTVKYCRKINEQVYMNKGELFLIK